MKILEQRIYRGPNLYAHFPVIRLRLDLGELEQWPSDKIPGFVDGLVAALPSLDQHGCSYGHEGGFVKRLREGTWMGHILEHAALEIQSLAGAGVTFGKTRGVGEQGVYHVIYQYAEERVGEAAGKLALRLLHSLLPEKLQPEDAKKDADFDFAAELEDLIGYAQRRQLGPSTASLVRAAEQRDIPWLRLNDYSLVQFGHGRYQKRIQATVTSETRHIAVEIASDKEETNQILADLGLPVPRQYLVRSAERAATVARRLGYPVVVKPLNANHGRGVSINLGDAEAVRVAFDKAREHSRTVIVETYIEGFDHRMLVVDGKLVAVAKRVPGHVVGDGEHSVEELVAIINADPRRGIGHEKVLTRIELDHQATRLLELAGKSKDTVLEAGEVFYLRSTGNLSTGGTAVDQTDVVHPDNREMAQRAAQAIGLDVAGIDFITPDISRSFREVGGAICEVNAAPGFRMHVAPTEGTPRDVAGPVMDMLFEPGAPTRIPIASVTGTNGKTTVSRMLAHILKMSGKTVGLTTTDGVYIDGERTVSGDMTGPVSARMVLRDPSVDAAVLETARGGLLRAGLGYRANNVGAVLNVQADHLGLGGIDTIEQLAAVKRIVVEVSRDCAVLNADDEQCLKMADYTKAERIAYVTRNPKHALVREHIRAGGAACVLEEGINGQMITLYDRGSHIPLLWTHLIPATLEGKALFNVQNAMFAALMARVMKVKIDNIRVGLRTFDTTFFQAPGRLNVFDDLPFKVILDYGHNPAAVGAMAETAASMEVNGRRLCVLAAPGDRRDEDIVAIAKQAAPHFDAFIVRRDDSLRGRKVGEVTGILMGALIGAGVSPSKVEVIEDEQAAIQAALERGERGDLLVIFGDNISRCWKQIVHFNDASADEGEVRSTIGDLASEVSIVDETPLPSSSGLVAGPESRDDDEIEPVKDDRSRATVVGGKDVIVDERGVRLAREEND
ncbi:cyanophycin synthetase [Plesiocystis pacifica SIR-1]|uniref:Cyanophycin synthetase n=1 Tax=Plesiocystis pacifica SIR-1 TaxID=391625 RepID=A6GJ53_9BACT|nr:cyanophycin synthetase [Plesiocystis pacifica]EDM74091.1 cyanophycin synthetase [Plesiocystis pacifica SIR-1]